MIKTLLTIGTGSFAGGVLRFLISRFIQNTFITSFPLGTFVVNIAGCFLIGLFYGLSEQYNFFSNEWRLFLTVGFCGGFTTFSTFSYENLALLHDGNILHFSLYVILSVIFCLLATYSGAIITKIL